MSKEMWKAIGAGLLSGAMALSLVSAGFIGVMMAYLAPLPLFFVGLGRGFPLALVAVGTGMSTAVLLGGPFIGVMYGLIDALPAATAIRLATWIRPDPAGGPARWFPVGHVIAWLSALAAAILVAVGLGTMASGETLGGILAGHLDAFFGSLAPGLSDEDRATLTSVMVPFFPGSIGISWVLMAVVNGSVAQTVLTRVKRNLRPSPVLAEIDLPGWAPWPLVLAAVVALAGSGELEYMGRNLVLVLSVPFLFLGLGVVHALARRLNLPGFAMVGFYVVLVIFAWAAALVAAVGFIEQLAGLRDRIAGPGGGRENE